MNNGVMSPVSLGELILNNATRIMEGNNMQYRGYRISPLGTFALVEIQAGGSGQIPNELKGTFTSMFLAQRAIDQSLERLKKGKRNDKKESVATD